MSIAHRRNVRDVMNPMNALSSRRWVWKLRLKAHRMAKDTTPASKVRPPSDSKNFPLIPPVWALQPLQRDSLVEDEEGKVLPRDGKPPFGLVQLAYQRGTAEFGKRSDQGNTFFLKATVVF